MSGAGGRPRVPVGNHGEVSNKEDTVTGRWTAKTRQRDADGVRRLVQVTRRTKESASQALQDALKARQPQTHGVVKASTPMSEIIDLYLIRLERSKKAVQTKARYRQSANKHIRAAWPGMTAPEIGAGMVLTFLEELAEEHLSEARTCRVVLKAIMQEALRSGVILTNPVPAAGALLAVPKSAPRALKSDDLHALRTAVAAWRTGPDVKGPKPNSDLLELIDVMLGCTARISEALALRAEDIRVDDSGHLTAEICGTIVWEKGVGTYRQPFPKNDRSHRIITPPDFAADVLRRRAFNGEWNLHFATKNGTPYLQQNIGRTLREIVAGTDLAWMTSHVLRKTSATTMANAENEGMAAAAHALGHEGESLAATTYVERDRLLPKSVALALLAPRPAAS